MSAADNQKREFILWCGLAIFALGLVILDAFAIVPSIVLPITVWAPIYGNWLSPCGFLAAVLFAILHLALSFFLFLLGARA
jgi:hypothetical protein